MKKTPKRIFQQICTIIFTCSLAFLSMFLLNPKSAKAEEFKPSDTHFMTYYRIWQDKNIIGKAEDMLGSHWMTMHDIPHGIDIINVFGGIPDNDENFYNILKNEYAAELHARGAKLVRGMMYPELLNVPCAGEKPTQEEIDAYAKKLYEEKVVKGGLDGIDIDMEQRPQASDVEKSNAVISALSKYIGPKAENGTLFLYDTNGTDMDPLKSVSDCFDFLGFQQYGGDDDTAAGVVNKYGKYMTPQQVIPGLTFPEAQDGNRWVDAQEPYEESHMYKVAKYVHDNNLGGMFTYAIDRDGRTYSGDDFTSNMPSNFLWTKTAILESKGWTVDAAKDAAKHNLARIKYAKGLSEDVISSTTKQIDAAANLYEVNKAVMGPSSSFETAPNSSFDAMLEKDLESIDITDLTDALNQADELIANKDNCTKEQTQALQTARDDAANGIGGKTYTKEQVDQWATALLSAVKAVKPEDAQPAGGDLPHFMTYYRVWQDKNIVGKPKDMPGSHWMTMSDIPYGIDLINVFGGIPDDDENFYNILKNEYAPELHARGAKLIRGMMYPELLEVPCAGTAPTQEEIDAYAKTLYEEKVLRGGLDGIDIDMEQFPTAEEAGISDAVISALSKYIGPKADNGTLFIYDTNGETMTPFKNVSDCFNYLGYQQYSGTETRTAPMIKAYGDYLTPDQIIPGLAFAEAGGANWGDISEPYEKSHMYRVAKYVREQKLGGMFVYAIDRDGKTNSGIDATTNSPSNFLWTKTAILESKGWALDDAKKMAEQNLNRIKYAKKLSADTVKETKQAIDASANLYEVNKAVMGSSSDFAKAVNSSFDPMLEKDLTAIDTTALTTALDKADAILADTSGYSDETVSALQTARDTAANGLGGKTYSADQIVQWQSNLQGAIDGLQVKEVPVASLKLGAAGIQVVKAGKTLDLAPAVAPEDATDKTVKYTFSKDGIVTADEKGVLTAVKPGMVKVTATAGDKTAAVTVRVTQ